MKLLPDSGSFTVRCDKTGSRPASCNQMLYPLIIFYISQLEVMLRFDMSSP
jgi:hypothetical protein